MEIETRRCLHHSAMVNEPPNRRPVTWGSILSTSTSTNRFAGGGADNSVDQKISGPKWIDWSRDQLFPFLSAHSSHERLAYFLPLPLRTAGPRIPCKRLSPFDLKLLVRHLFDSRETFAPLGYSSMQDSFDEAYSGAVPLTGPPGWCSCKAVHPRIRWRFSPLLRRFCRKWLGMQSMHLPKPGCDDLWCRSSERLRGEIMLGGHVKRLRWLEEGLAIGTSAAA